jgi:NAD(P)-dependent dehydrogenase (short-subunit alcohol dehydrogenase family)
VSDHVVLITGALTGIGRATALAFAKEGARIIVSGRRDDAGQALVTELGALGAESKFIAADVRHESEVQKLVDETVARFGRLDVAVNNAGTEGVTGPVTAQTAESYAATFDTNVLGVLLSMKHELRVMQAQRAGSIINLSSTMGHRGAPNASLYVASKHAVEGLTKSAALEAAAFGTPQSRDRLSHAPSTWGASTHTNDWPRLVRGFFVRQAPLLPGRPGPHTEHKSSAC